MNILHIHFIIFEINIFCESKKHFIAYVFQLKFNQNLPVFDGIFRINGTVFEPFRFFTGSAEIKSIIFNQLR